MSNEIVIHPYSGCYSTIKRNKVSNHNETRMSPLLLSDRSQSDKTTNPMISIMTFWKSKTMDIIRILKKKKDLKR